MNVAARLAQLQTRVAQLQGEIRTAPPLPPIIIGNELAALVAFSFASPSTQIFGGILPGAVFSEAAIFIVNAFDAPATAQLGSSADLGLLLAATDSRLSAVGQYQSDALVVASVSDVLQFTLNTAGASVGAGYIFYRMLPP